MVERKKGILRNPIISFLLGFLVATGIWLYPMMVIGAIIIIGMVLFAFRDKIDLEDLKGALVGSTEERRSTKIKSKLENSSKSERVRTKGSNDFRVCPECGSKTKHRRWCSHYGESKRPPKKPLGFKVDVE